MGTHANLVSTYLAALGRGRTQGLAHSRHPTVPPSPPPTMRPKGATSALERGPPAHTHTTAMCNSRMVTDMLNRAGVQRRRGVRGMHAAREGATWSLPFGGLRAAFFFLAGTCKEQRRLHSKNPDGHRGGKIRPYGPYITRTSLFKPQQYYQTQRGSDVRTAHPPRAVTA